MGISNAVQWWQEEQLRILVLGSLFLQLFLLLVATFRRYATHNLLKSLTWLAYLGSDAVAIYALATLFNLQKMQDQSLRGGKRILEVLWAPFLLMHLGGQDGISAYNIEDNELWKRHILTALSQITVAIYVFCKSWPGGDGNLFSASILLFVPGILKCIEKPLSLKNASIYSLVSSSGPAIRKGEVIWSHIDYVKKAKKAIDKEEGIAEDVETGQTSETSRKERETKECEVYKIFMKGLLSAAQGEGDAADPEATQLPQVQGLTCDKRNCLARIRGRILDIIHRRQQRRTASQMKRVKEVIAEAMVRKLFVDLGTPYPDRLCILKAFWVLDGKQAYVLLHKWIARMFSLLYTKVKSIDPMSDLSVGTKNQRFNFQMLYISCAGLARRFLPLASIGLFHHSHKKNYEATDVKITLILFIGTIIIEFYSYLGSALSGLSCVVAQYSLIGFFARNKRHAKKMSILTFLNCKDFLDQHWYINSCHSSAEVTELVHKYVKEGWEKIEDPHKFWSFNDSWGQCTLKNSGGDKADLGWSLKRSFDETVILWHIATDFCFYNNMSAATAKDASSYQGHEDAAWCEG